MAIRLGIDMKLFDVVAQHTKSGPVALSQLADTTEADPLLVCK